MKNETKNPAATPIEDFLANPGPAFDPGYFVRRDCLPEERVTAAEYAAMPEESRCPFLRSMDAIRNDACAECQNAERCAAFRAEPQFYWDGFSDEEIVRAAELMICPGDLANRGAVTLFFEALGICPDDVAEHLGNGERFNDGPAFAGLGTDAPRIVAG